MQNAPDYSNVAKFAETNTSHPQRVAIAFHIRSGQYDLALELLASDAAEGNTARYPQLQMMIEHLRKVETPQEYQQSA